MKFSENPDPIQSSPWIDPIHVHFRCNYSTCIVTMFVWIFCCSLYRDWRNGNRVDYICRVNLRRARLVLGLVTLGWCVIPVFI